MAKPFHKNVVDPARPHLGGNIRGGDPNSYEDKVWSLLDLHVKPTSVFDVGCGEGHAMTWFASQGCAVVGLEGLEENAAKVGHPVIVHDLTRGPIVMAGIDLVWCCEVVEHIAPAFVGHLIATITCGRVLAMTHAQPRQTGYHHVNCQPDDYWAGEIELRSPMRFDRELTVMCRAAATGWFKKSGLIFQRPSKD